MKTLAISLAVFAAALTLSVYGQEKSPGAGPIVVLETARGTIEFETYPEEAPKTVARIVDLVKKNFYTGLRFHRVEPSFVIQVGDPASRDMSRMAEWGRRGSGTPIGVAEMTKKRKHVLGAVAMAHVGDPKLADSQFYILKRNAPELDGKYTVFGKVLTGMDVVGKIQKGDVLKRAYLKDEAAKF
jgi:cyclophilin family peptidyl-prolyl cis-trans isomerase